MGNMDKTRDHPCKISTPTGGGLSSGPSVVRDAVDSTSKSQENQRVLKMVHVDYFYKSGGIPFQALHDITIEIAAGEFVAITGSSGCGKSTLMNIIGTLALPPGAFAPTVPDPSSQSVRARVKNRGQTNDLASDTPNRSLMELAGTELQGLSSDAVAPLRNRDIGFIFQQFHLLPRLTALQNIMMPLSYRDPKPTSQEKRHYRQRALALLERLGIKDQAHKYPPTLSGGQKQRVAIARALLLDPKILLADEPTGALDSKTSHEVMELFAELHAEGRTVIVITHDPEVTRYAKRKISMSDGRIVADEAQIGTSPAQASSQRQSQDALDKNFLPQSSPSDRQSLINRAQEIFLALMLSLFAPVADAYQALSSSKLRTLLTSLGLTIGVGAITTMITLGNGARDVILGIFNQVGGDRIFIGMDYRAIWRSGGGYWPGVDLEKDLPVLQKTFADFCTIFPNSEGGEIKVFGGGQSYSTSFSTVYNLQDALNNNYQVEKGRMFTPYEYLHGGQVALVGSEFTNNLFPPNAPARSRNPQFPVGEKISIRGMFETTFTIVGVLTPRDNPFNMKDMNTQILIPRATFTHYTGIKKSIWINAAPKKNVEHRWLADSITNFLAMRTGLKYPFRAHVPEEFISKIMIFVTIFQALTALIGFLCILVGGIGIMNIMLVTITERVKEIGLRKALGASGSDITKQFLIECLFLCFISGLVGAVGGGLFCNLVAIVGHMFVPKYVPDQLLLDPYGLVAGLATAIGCGLTFGMMPALKAARMDPSEALRSE